MEPTREEMAAILRSKVYPTGCWKDFNAHYKAWRSMKAYSEAGGDNLLKPGEAPDEPQVDGYSDLDSDCQSQ